MAAIADLDTGRAATAAAGIPGARALEVPALLADPDIDVVLNLTIPAAHAEIALGGHRERQACVRREAARGRSGERAAGDRMPRPPPASASAPHPTPCSAPEPRPRARSSTRAASAGRSPRPRSWRRPARSRGTRTPTSTSCPAAVRSWTWAPTTSPRSCTCWVRSTAVVGSASRLRSERVIGSGSASGRAHPGRGRHARVRHPRACERGAVDAHDELRQRQDQCRADRDPRRDRVALGSRPEHVLGRRLVLRARIDASGSRSATAAGYVDAARGIGLLDMLAAPNDADVRASGRLALHTLEVMTAVLDSARTGARVTLDTTVERPPLVPLGCSSTCGEL